MSYIELQREHQILLIKNKKIFQNAKVGGVFRGISRPYILKDGKFNLYKEIAQEVLDYFKANGINWWSLEQKDNSPSGHILSSQISCVNHLFPIRKNKEAVVRLLKTIDADFVDVVTIESDKPETRSYIAFEVVCMEDYLNEKNLIRGANSTSVDALIIGKMNNGENVLVPIEWKYTESYSCGASSDKSLGSSGEIRRGRYRNLIEKSKYLKNINLEVYHFEPFYQLMRQTLWAEHMVANGYADSVGFINVHVIPEKNLELLKSGDHKYHIGGRSGSLAELWAEQINNTNLYKTISPNVLLANQPNGEWKEYIEMRYWQ